MTNESMQRMVILVKHRSIYFALRKSGVNLCQRRKKLSQRIRGVQETVNQRFKQFGSLRQIFRHPIEKHASVFRAVAVTTQVNIEQGNLLFEI